MSLFHLYETRVLVLRRLRYRHQLPHVATTPGRSSLLQDRIKERGVGIKGYKHTTQGSPTVALSHHHETEALERATRQTI